MIHRFRMLQQDRPACLALKHALEAGVAEPTESMLILRWTDHANHRWTNLMVLAKKASRNDNC